MFTSIHNIGAYHKENISNVHIYNRAVHNLSGEFINIYKIDEGGKEHSGNASTEVIHSSNNIPLTGETESVQTINLEDVLKIADSKYIDYMKIDCEGAEYNFLINKELSKTPKSLVFEFINLAKICLFWSIF